MNKRKIKSPCVWLKCLIWLQFFGGRKTRFARPRHCSRQTNWLSQITWTPVQLMIRFGKSFFFAKNQVRFAMQLVEIKFCDRNIISCCMWTSQFRLSPLPSPPPLHPPLFYTAVQISNLRLYHHVLTVIFNFTSHLLLR